MSSKISLAIDEDLLDALGQAVPGQKSPLSLLNVKGTGKVAAEKMARLQSAGIIDAVGNVKQDYRQVLDALAKARNVSTLKYTAGSRLFEFIVSFPESKSSPSISVFHDGNQLIIEAPASVEKAFTLIDQNVGHSKLASSSFSGILSTEEAMAVFALMDLERAANLRAIAGGTALKSGAFELSAIIGKVINRKDSFQSLEFVLQSRLDLAAPPTSAQIESGLKSLVDKKLVVQEGSKYHLSKELSHFAGRLPIIDNYVTIESGRLDPNDKLIFASFTALQAGVNDILYLENRDQEVVVRSVSGMQLVGLIAKFLNEPDAIKLPNAANKTSQPTQATSANPKKYCKECGTALEPSSKFCPNCGNKISP
jgi:hypothetical protein